MDMSSIHQVRPKPTCKAQWKEEENKADRRRGGKTPSAHLNGQAWSLPSPREQWKTEKKWRKLVVKSSVVPQWASCLWDKWRWRCSECVFVWTCALGRWMYHYKVHSIHTSFFETVIVTRNTSFTPLYWINLENTVKMPHRAKQAS